MLRVLIDGLMLGRKRAGDETFFLNLAKHLAQKEEVELYLAVPRGINPQIANAHIIEMNNSVTSRLFLTHLAERYAVDVVHSNYYTPLPSRRRIKRVVTIHDVAWVHEPRWFTWRQRVKLNGAVFLSRKMADLTLTVSRYSADEIHKHYPSVNAIPVYLGADHIPPIETMRRHSKTTKKQILMVGAHNPRKNFDLVVRSIEILTSRLDVELLVVGPKLDDHGNGREFVRSLGYVTNEQLLELYDQCDALMYLSDYEGFGLPPLEAMRRGLPPVVLSASCLPEILGESACFVNRDPADVAHGLFELLVDGQKWEHFSVKGLECANKYTWEQAAEEHLQLYKSLIKEG